MHKRSARDWKIAISNNFFHSGWWEESNVWSDGVWKRSEWQMDLGAGIVQTDWSIPETYKVAL